MEANLIPPLFPVVKEKAPGDGGSLGAGSKPRPMDGDSLLKQKCYENNVYRYNLSKKGDYRP